MKTQFFGGINPWQRLFEQPKPAKKKPTPKPKPITPKKPRMTKTRKTTQVPA